MPPSSPLFLSVTGSVYFPVDLQRGSRPSSMHAGNGASLRARIKPAFSSSPCITRASIIPRLYECLMIVRVENTAIVSTGMPLDFVYFFSRRFFFISEVVRVFQLISTWGYFGQLDFL